MAIYEVTAPNGQILEIEGDTPPSEAELDEIFNTTNTTVKEPTKSQSKGIDLTPSGISRNIAAGIVTPIQAIKNNQSLPEAYNAVQNEMQTNPVFKHPVRDLAQDTMAAFYLPQVNVLKGAGLASRLGNYALTGAEQGGVIGGLEGLKENGLEGLLGGAGLGAVAGGLIGGGLPLVGNVAKTVVASKPVKYLANKAVESLTSLKPKTIQQVVKPNSQALDLTEEGAQNLLMDTTERVQQDYKNLLDNAGLDVQRAALTLPEERGVWASSLKDSLDDIYAGYSTSNIKELNPAFNNAGDIYDDISALIEAGTDETGQKISAANLNDIMGNLKNYPIDWSKTTAKDRQAILKQIYSDYARRLGNLSPELRKANANYAKLAKFDDNEGVRKIINPNVIKGENIDSASSALRNYNSTITKGNTNRNVQDLEKILVENGKEPFLNAIDDVNAANDLLKNIETGRNWLGATTFAKGLTTPVLKLAREINRRGLPERFSSVGRQIPRYLVPLLYGGPRLYGGVEYSE